MIVFYLQTYIICTLTYQIALQSGVHVIFKVLAAAILLYSEILGWQGQMLSSFQSDSANKRLHIW